MSELLKSRLKESEGKVILIFLHNNFRFTGKCLGSDEKYMELLDFKSNAIKVIEISQIKELEVKDG